MKKYYSDERCCECGGYFRGIKIPMKYGYVCPACYRELNGMEGYDDQDNEEDEEGFFDGASELLEGEMDEPDLDEPILNPREIVEYLDQYVMGQEKAKKQLAVAAYNHHARITHPHLKLKKSNVLLYGPTGSGKTYTIQKMADILKVPLVIADASTITEAGYKGGKIEHAILELYYAADCDIKKAERGIVFFDEFDKLSTKLGHTTEAGPSVGSMVQRQMLKCIEGTKVRIPREMMQRVGESRVKETICIDTSNILFICGGAFVGLEKKKNQKVRKIGFYGTNDISEEEPSAEGQVGTEEFLEYGIIPELMGRLPVIVGLNELNEEDLYHILKESKESVLNAHIDFFWEEGIDLIFSDEAIREIAHLAHVRKVGARGIQTIVEDVMQPIIFEVFSGPQREKCVVTRECVQGIEPPSID